MAVPIAVVDPLPLFRRGVATLLADVGHEVSTPDDVLAWARGQAACLILLTLHVEHDWQLLARLVSREHLVVVLLERGSDAEGMQALMAGARSVLPRAAAERSLLRTVAATLEDEAVMPARVAAALLETDRGGSAPRSAVPAEQAAWLRRLAGGSTVAQLASDSGYSERTMYRLLQALYRRMGVHNRVEAVLRAKEQGWLEG